MKKKQAIFYLLLLTLFATNTLSQYPQYFTCDNENGLPSNDVYSIIQDNKGFIWVGCDAGLFKYDGVRYISYKCKTQNSKSITNLTLLKGSKLFCLNFQDQIFYLERDSLKELHHPLQKISNIAVDQNGLLFANHSNGVSFFNLQTQEWKSVEGISDFTRSVDVNDQNEVYSLVQNGITKLTNDKPEIYTISPDENNVASNFLLICHQNEVWAFKRDGSDVYTLENKKIEKKESKKIGLALHNQKITGLNSLSDGKIWICTYKGIIRYDTENDSVQVFYPDIAFSDVLTDREGNYWFATLQTGMLRVPDLNYLVWNNTNSDVSNEKLTHITTDGTHIYFSSVSGTIGKLNTLNYTLSSYHTSKNADIECMFFDTTENQLFFHSQNSSYLLRDDKIDATDFQYSALKSVIHIAPFYFFGNSQGLYASSGEGEVKIGNIWTRQLAWNNHNKTLYAATNKGLQVFEQKKNEWVCTKTLFENRQIVSIDFDEKSQQLFLLAFEGKIYSVSAKNNATEVASLPGDVQGNIVKHDKDHLFAATNKGVWIFNRETKEWNNLNAISGLTSDNVQDLLVLNGNLWIATGKGLQKIPLNRITEKPLAKIYLKNAETKNISLEYNQSLVLLPELAHYSSKGQFEYAYRINLQDWVKLPANIEQIEIQNIPPGNFEIELKAVDYSGRDSENSILISGYVKPPFWLTWWFIVIAILLLSGIVYWIYRRQLFKQKQALKQQNELNLAKLTAIRSQMNPHFIFNSLNSIQDLILQQKTVESYDYVVLFSELVRNALNYSNKEFIPIQKETAFLDTYLQLEKLRFKDDFTYRIEYNQNDEIDVPSLLIQPFVENALLHGLLHKEGKKELSIKFIFENEQLICIIEDNGIGRKQSGIIHSRQGGTHQSFALDAIQKRLDIINEQQKQIIGKFTFEDLYPEEEYIGTRVIINVPFRRHY